LGFATRSIRARGWRWGRSVVAGAGRGYDRLQRAFARRSIPRLPARPCAFRGSQFNRIAVKQDEDLFAETTMTFGEHLEELRTALFKAVAGLAVGMLLGLLVGKQMVALIEAPLTKALGTYYQKDATEKYTEINAELQQHGVVLPYTPEQVDYLVDEKRMLYELRFVDPAQLAAVSADAAGKKPAQRSSAADAPVPLVPVMLWHSLDDDERTHPKAFAMGEPFSMWMKASLVVGVIISSPWVFYHVWSFVAAGLYPHEKRYVHIFLPFSLGLFLLGAATAYLFVFQPVLDFLLSFNRWLHLGPEPRISEWLSFVLLLPLGFGASFQLPLVMLFLERIGIFTVSGYLQKWRLSILVIFILSAVLTPADPYSLLLMALPLCALYFGGIVLCKLMPRTKTEFAV
jgi:sec-independent protein translocase protein TatC